MKTNEPRTIGIPDARYMNLEMVARRNRPGSPRLVEFVHQDEINATWSDWWQQLSEPNRQAIRDGRVTRIDDVSGAPWLVVK